MIKDLYEKQEQLDNYILNKKGLKKEDIIDDIVLALFVELGELANEVKCFKFWSNKEASSKEVILEEYVDCLHFILSIGNFLGATKEIKITKKSDWNINDLRETLTNTFNSLFVKLGYFYNHNYDRTRYEGILFNFAFLAMLLDFTEEEIYNAYIKKNKVNFERQNNNY